MQARFVVTDEYGHRYLGDDRARVDAFVDNEQGGAGNLDSVCQRISWSVHTCERRGKSRMGVDRAAAEGLQECGTGQFHEPGKYDKVRQKACNLRGQRDIPRRAVTVVVGRDDKRVDAGLPSLFESANRAS